MRPPSSPFRWRWRNPSFRALAYQLLTLLVLVAAGAYLLHNTLENLRARGVQSGFDFILQPAGFAIGESILPFDAADSYGKAYLVGLTNTLRVALVGIVLATVIGTLVGIGRLSHNLLVRGACATYVEVMRSVPVLLQLLMWYFALTEFLPSIEGAVNPVAGFFLSKNGLQFPLPVWHAGHLGTLAGLALGALAARAWARRARRHREATGRNWPVALPSLLLMAGLAAAGWLAGGSPAGLDMPARTEVSVIGGGAVTPEYLTILLGLSFYTASYIAEIVRAGIQSVPRGQSEASAAIGLSRARALRLVLLPQALRVVIPPLTSQYLNLTKASSLGVAVGYPDLVSISATSLNQTGRAIECIALMMACFLTMSLLTSAFMSTYNRRAKFRGGHD